MAASEKLLDLKPVLINWSHRHLMLMMEEWLFDAGYSFNMHVVERLNNDPGLKLKIFTSINLSNNELESIPAVLFQLPSLKCLNLSHNKLTMLPGMSEHSNETAKFTDNWNSPSLEELELQHNCLTIPPKVLFAMPILQSINLGNNKITSLPFDMWIAPRLKILILEHNCLNEFPCFSDGSGRKRAVYEVRKDNR